jgi:hypothetical protein
MGKPYADDLRGVAVRLIGEADSARRWLGLGRAAWRRAHKRKSRDGRGIPPRRGADSMAEGRDDIDHIHDQTLVAVAGMISAAPLTE